jgi:hypothetical protein
MKSFFRHLFFLSTFLLLTNAIQCYFPDGSESSDIACSTTETSACCGRGSACLSNGLCMHTKYNGAAEPQGSWYGRGSCTDLSWKSEKCPQYCIQKGRDVRNNGMGVNKCDAEGDNEQYYWCANNATKGMDSKEACSNATNYFTIKGGKSSIEERIIVILISM